MYHLSYLDIKHEIQWGGVKITPPTYPGFQAPPAGLKYSKLKTYPLDLRKDYALACPVQSCTGSPLDDVLLLHPPGKYAFG